MRHQHQLAPDADPDIALAIGLSGMKEGNIRSNRRGQQDRIVVAERVVHDLPVRTVGHEIRAEDTA